MFEVGVLWARPPQLPVVCVSPETLKADGCPFILSPQLRSVTMCVHTRAHEAACGPQELFLHTAPFQNAGLKLPASCGLPGA